MCAREDVIRKGTLMAYLRKLTALLLCISMIFCLFSCGKEEEQTDPDVPEDENGGEQTDGGEEEFNPYPYEDLSVFMDLPNYKIVTISQAALDQMVNNTVSNFLAENDLYTQVFDRKVQNGDKVTIDFVGMLDGEAFQGGTASDYELVIGSGSFIDGFESGVIGMEIGDVKDLNLKFPENYNPELAGKEVVFTVTLDEIWEVPELTDEMCAEYTGYSTASAYVESIKTDGIFEYAWNQLLQQCKIKAYPDEYTEYYQSYVNYFTDVASRYSVSFEDFLQTYASYYSDYGLHSGMSTAQFYMVAENYAESNLVNDLLMYSLLRAEGITVGGEAFEVAKGRLELEYGVSYEELKETYESTSVIISVLNIALANRLCEYVTIVK